MLVDKDRLKKCDNIFFAVVGACENPEKYFEIFIIMSEKISDKDRQMLRQNISVRSMGPRVVVAMAQLEKIYWLNCLGDDVVDQISAPTDPDLDNFLRLLTRPPNVEKNNKIWLQRFVDGVSKMLGRS